MADIQDLLGPYSFPPEGVQRVAEEADVSLQEAAAAIRMMLDELSSAIAATLSEGFLGTYREAEAAYRTSHRRLPGSWRTSRLAKKRMTLVRRWYEQHHTHPTPP